MTVISTNILGQMILLGTGTSVGVPAIGCDCSVCRSNDPRDRRLRCSAILGLPQGNLLIDTPPDLRTQLLREQIARIDAVAFTHEHADHIFGLDDLRIFQFYMDHPMPLYCEPPVEDRIRRAFDYAFDGQVLTHSGATPKLTFRRIDTTPFDVLGARVIPLRLQHGPRFEVLGFRVNNVAYCTDVKTIPEETWPLLEGLDTLVIDGLRARPHATHMCLEEAIEAARRVQPRQTYFTHIAHELAYEETNAKLPPRMKLSYDGLRIPLR